MLLSFADSSVASRSRSVAARRPRPRPRPRPRDLRPARDHVRRLSRPTAAHARARPLASAAARAHSLPTTAAAHTPARQAALALALHLHRRAGLATAIGRRRGQHLRSALPQHESAHGSASRRGSTISHILSDRPRAPRPWNITACPSVSVCGSSSFGAPALPSRLSLLYRRVR